MALAKKVYVDQIGTRFDLEYDDSENDRDGYIEDGEPFDEVGFVDSD